MSAPEMMAEPDWLAAEPTARRKLTAIMAAVRRCYAECPVDPEKRTGPHMTTDMAELFIGQLLMKATGPACPTPCDADCEQACHEVHAYKREHYPETCVGSIAAAARAFEREECALLAAEVGATYPLMPEPGFITAHPPFADLLREGQ